MNDDNPLLSGAPTWADAYNYNANALGDWLTQQRAKSAQAGLWDDQTGLPTGAGIVNAARQYGNALLMGTTSPRSVPKSLYHVAGPDYKPGEPLQSLYSRFGNKAYDMYAERWPEAGDMAQYHPHYTMFYDSLGAAREHPTEGTVLKVNPDSIKDGLRFDELEQPGFWVTPDDVPAHAITVVPPE